MALKGGAILPIDATARARPTTVPTDTATTLRRSFCDKNGKVTRVPYREHVPPDVTACIFWLKNRKPPGGANRAQQGGDGLARDTRPGNCGRARRGLWQRIPDLPRRRHAFRRSRCATVGHGDQVGPGPRHGRRRADAQASARRRGARADLLRAHLQDRFRISEVRSSKPSTPNF